MQQMQSAWDSHSASTHHGLTPLKGDAIDISKVVNICCDWGSFTAIKRVQPACHSIPVQHECAAANARGLRFNQIQNHLRGNRSINRGPTIGQDIYRRAGC
jgi:hypothetical protein